MASLSFRLPFVLLLVAAASAAFAQPALEQAISLIDQGQFFAAERLVEPLAQEKKPDPAVLWALSRVRTGQGQTAEAIKLAEKAIKLDGRQARFHAQLGTALWAHIGEASRIDQGSLANRLRKAFEKALSLNPNDLAAVQGLSRFYRSAPPTLGGDLAKAQQFADRTRQLDPFKGEIELGALASRRGKFEEALQHFEAAAEINPRDADAQIACGNVLLRLDRLREARERYTKALRLAPNSELARSALETVEKAQALPRPR